jgi:anti-anti-sigma regulatory factor
LLINVSPAARALHLQIVGELDVATNGRLALLLEQLEGAPRLVLVDLAAVRFADASGLSPFFDSAERRLIKGLPALTVAAASRSVQLVLDLLHGDCGVRAFAVAAHRNGSAPDDRRAGIRRVAGS